MYEKKLDLGDVCYILKVELILKSEIISSVLKFPEYCVELSLDSVNWVTVAGLPLNDAGNIDIVQGICIPINAKARYIRLISTYGMPGLECELKVTTGQLHDFITGVDVSHLQQIEDFGGRYYNRQGIEQDCMEILKEQGVNCIRLKVWNRPGLPNSDPAGYNDMQHVLVMSRRVKKLGFKLLIDFHYSDWWTDPGKQFMPEDWKDLNFEELNVALYKFTYNLISALKGQGTMPEMVQVGNEITNGMLWDIARVGGEYDTDEQWDKLCRLLNSGLNAVKAVDGSIRTIIHIERGGDNGRSVFFFDKLKNRGVQFDIIGLSYYSIWHGSISAFRNNVNDLALRYGKDIAVVETAHPYTTENGDDTPNATSFPYGSMLPEYPATIQGQANNLHSVISILKEAPDGRGIGVFYWQPDFIPVKGAGWKYGEGCEWDDQTMFDFKGYALWSLDVFKMHSPEA